MIWLTKLDGSPIMLNDDQIVFVEMLHETLISLANGDKVRVLESPNQIVSRIAQWRRRVTGLDLPMEMESEPGRDD